MNTKQEKLEFLNKELGTNFTSFDEIDWVTVTLSNQFSLPLYHEFKNNIDWFLVSMHKPLSESFIREFKDYVEWKRISCYQILSESFIREFADKVNWNEIASVQNLSESFIIEFENKSGEIGKYLKFRSENWIYRNKKFLKQQVIDTGLFECYEDYFIAYKGIRSDRFSKFNFRYQYLPNQTYESWCDCCRFCNSFGLHVTTENQARFYSKELVVRVKVKYEDVGRILNGMSNIRCRKITILD